MRILVAEDERDLNNVICNKLRASGYSVDACFNGTDALHYILLNRYDGVLLDIMMPGMDGITAVTRLRDSYNLPVILLTAKSEDTDKVLGLNVGADDYVTKPFNPVELLARVKSQLRRYLRLGGGSVRPTAITVGAVSLDDESKSVTVDGESVSLTPIEYDILRFLMQNAGKVFSPQEIYRRVWHEAPAAESPVPVHIRHIREKIEINPAEPRYLKVVWGKGYKMEVDAK